MNKKNGTSVSASGRAEREPGSAKDKRTDSGAEGGDRAVRSGTSVSASGRAEREPGSAEDKEYIYGRNTVLAFLEAASGQDASEDGGQLDKIFLVQGFSGPDKRVEQIKRLARQQGVPVLISTKQQLERLTDKQCKHQGVVARLSQVKALKLIDFLHSIEKQSFLTEDEKKESIFLVIIDGIQDPHNLGAIVRTAEAAGAKGLITTMRRTAGTTASVARASAGALARLPIVKVQNLVSTIGELKKHGFWIAGLDANAQINLFEHDLCMPLAVIVGSEGKGLSRLVAENCDFLVRIPMSPGCQSLNAAVAASIVFYEYVRQNYVKKNN